MCELTIVDDLCNTSFEVSLQKDTEIFDIGLLSHICNQALMNCLQKGRLVLMDIELFIVKSNQLVIEASFTFVQIHEFVRRAKKE